MWTRILVALSLAWAVLLPPLFTRGACTAEFEAEAHRIDADRGALSDPAHAVDYWRRRRIPVYNVPNETCRRSRPRFVTECPDGPLVYARVPVRNDICRVYRDDSILVQLRYDGRNRLARTQVDMAPFKSLPLPFTRATLDWAK